MNKLNDTHENINDAKSKSIDNNQEQGYNDTFATLEKIKEILKENNNIRRRKY